MIIPPSQLAPETLRALLEEFITREGTDYGVQELDLEQKVQRLQRQLDGGDIVIVFDADSESCNIVSCEELL